VNENVSAPFARVLCVEDDKDTCELLTFIFPEFDFVFAHSIDSALDRVDKEPVELYILDNWLPDGSGVELCQKIREFNTSVPIVFTSAAARNRDRDEALAAGADRYIVKPYDPEDIRKIVKDLFVN
jgi:DNA-binding response OmpR family regulator